VSILDVHCFSIIFECFYICILVEGQEITKEESSIIPTYDAVTTDPSKVYRLEDIVTPAEYDAIDIQAFLKAKTEKDRLTLLPYSYVLCLRS
jgi:hypothetical protein